MTSLFEKFKPWLMNFILEEKPDQPMRPRMLYLLKALPNPCAGIEGGCAKQAFDGDLSITALFTAQALRSANLGINNGHPSSTTGDTTHTLTTNWNRTRILVRKYSLSILLSEQKEDTKFILKVDDFILWNQEAGFTHKIEPLCCMELVPVKCKAHSIWLKSRENDAHTSTEADMSMSSVPLTQLLQKLNEDSQTQSEVSLLDLHTSGSSKFPIRRESKDMDFTPSLSSGVNIDLTVHVSGDETSNEMPERLQKRNMIKMSDFVISHDQEDLLRNMAVWKSFNDDVEPNPAISSNMPTLPGQLSYIGDSTGSQKILNKLPVEVIPGCSRISSDESFVNRQSVPFNHTNGQNKSEATYASAISKDRFISKHDQSQQRLEQMNVLSPGQAKSTMKYPNKQTSGTKVRMTTLLDSEQKFPWLGTCTLAPSDLRDENNSSSESLRLSMDDENTERLLSSVITKKLDAPSDCTQIDTDEGLHVQCSLVPQENNDEEKSQYCAGVDEVAQSAVKLKDCTLSQSLVESVNDTEESVRHRFILSPPRASGSQPSQVIEISSEEVADVQSSGEASTLDMKAPASQHIGTRPGHKQYEAVGAQVGPSMLMGSLDPQHSPLSTNVNHQSSKKIPHHDSSETLFSSPEAREHVYEQWTCQDAESSIDLDDMDKQLITLAYLQQNKSCAISEYSLSPPKSPITDGAVVHSTQLEQDKMGTTRSLVLPDLPISPVCENSAPAHTQSPIQESIQDGQKLPSSSSVDDSQPGNGDEGRNKLQSPGTSYVIQEQQIKTIPTAVGHHCRMTSPGYQYSPDYKQEQNRLENMVHRTSIEACELVEMDRLEHLSPTCHLRAESVDHDKHKPELCKNQPQSQSLQTNNSVDNDSLMCQIASVKGSGKTSSACLANKSKQKGKASKLPKKTNAFDTSKCIPKLPGVVKKSKSDINVLFSKNCSTKDNKIVHVSKSQGKRKLYNMSAILENVSPRVEKSKSCHPSAITPPEKPATRSLRHTSINKTVTGPSTSVIPRMTISQSMVCDLKLQKSFQPVVRLSPLSRKYCVKGLSSKSGTLVSSKRTKNRCVIPTKSRFSKSLVSVVTSAASLNNSCQHESNLTSPDPDYSPLLTYDVRSKQHSANLQISESVLQKDPCPMTLPTPKNSLQPNQMARSTAESSVVGGKSIDRSRDHAGVISPFGCDGLLSEKTMMLQDIQNLLEDECLVKTSDYSRHQASISDEVSEFVCEYFKQSKFA